MSVDEVILYSGYLITIFGIFGNSLSLYYFLSQTTSNSQQRNTETSTTNLFVMLNCFDLLVCTSSFVSSFDLDGDTNLRNVEKMYMVSLEMTYFITCLLSVRRLINLIYPLYMVRQKSLNVAIAIFSFIITAIEIILSVLPETDKLAEYIEKAQCLALVSLIIIIISSTLISLIKLKQSYTQDQHRRTRYATITVGILAAIFCICNAIPLVVSGLIVFHPNRDDSIHPDLLCMAIYVLVPLNSASNPVVYITRRSDMRTFLTTKCRGVIRYCKCGSGDTGRSEEVS